MLDRAIVRTVYISLAEDFIHIVCHIYGLGKRTWHTLDPIFTFTILRSVLHTEKLIQFVVIKPLLYFFIVIVPKFFVVFH
jgi:hypothetical protein